MLNIVGTLQCRSGQIIDWDMLTRLKLFKIYALGYDNFVFYTFYSISLLNVDVDDNKTKFAKLRRNSSYCSIFKSSHFAKIYEDICPC